MADNDHTLVDAVEAPPPALLPPPLLAAAVSNEGTNLSMDNVAAAVANDGGIGVVVVNIEGFADNVSDMPSLGAAANSTPVAAVATDAANEEALILHAKRCVQYSKSGWPGYRVTRQGVNKFTAKPKTKTSAVRSW
jgi:hypothetical protein